MSERLKNMGRLEMRRLEAQEMKLKLETLRDSIRDELDPFERLDKIDGGKVKVLAGAFKRLLGEYRRAMMEINQLKRVV